ncbi:MAG: M23 family metallopeptidase [Christensenellaceae bacterium]|jgi:murein DD-endopeptidase MepM/ murein hydrolase activator NlpD|nr:M23 family metallopeptidase [Christensenellaceae bacterium]
MQAKKNNKNLVRNILYSTLGVIMVAALAVGIALIPRNGVPETPGDINNPPPGSEIPVDGGEVEFIMPLEGGAIIKDFSDTALRFNSTLKQWEAHKAIDISAESGTPVLSVLDGTVVKIENTYLLGTTVTVEHADGLKSVYASLNSDVAVSEGQQVKQGDVIGAVSNSAKGELNDGPHLHFEILKDNKKVNPHLYISFSDK